jgi:hypothetical protein
MKEDSQKFEKWMRFGFETKNAHGAWENAQRFFAEHGISTAHAPTLQSRFMTACYNSEHEKARAAFEALVATCKADHSPAQMYYIADDIMPTSDVYSKPVATPH